MNDELGFEHLTKRQLVKFCKKFHKDCYRLVGQKMKLKDQLEKARQHIDKLLCLLDDFAKDEIDSGGRVYMEQARFFLKETK